VHFDWHGPMPAPDNQNPEPESRCRWRRRLPARRPPCQCQGAVTNGQPVDASSGVENITKTDIAVGGLRGGIAITRIFRSLSTNIGPFGFGTSHNYNYRLDAPSRKAWLLVNLITAGRQPLSVLSCHA